MKDYAINLDIQVYENEADAERIEALTVALMDQLKDLNPEFLERKITKQALQGAKVGDPITIGAVILGITSATIPPLIAFLQNWVGTQRKVTVETPNGLKLEFIPNKQYSEDEILVFINKLNQISHNGK